MRLGGVEASTIEGNVYTFNVSADLSDGTPQAVKTLEITGVNFPFEEEIGITGQQNCEASISQLTYGDPTTIKGAITRVTPDGNATCQLTLSLGSIVQVVINYTITYPPTEPEITEVKFGNLSPSTTVGNRYTFQGLQIDLNNVASLSDTLLIKGERLPSDALTIRTQTGCSATLNALTYEDPTTQRGAIVTITPSSGVSTCSVEIAFGDIAVVVLQCSVTQPSLNVERAWWNNQEMTKIADDQYRFSLGALSASDLPSSQNDILLIGFNAPPSVNYDKIEVESFINYRATSSKKVGVLKSASYVQQRYLQLNADFSAISVDQSGIQEKGYQINVYYDGGTRRMSFFASWL